jgi:hypothetical protein
MERQFRYRRWRIATTAVFGTLCILLVALWIRSYSRRDAVYIDFRFSQSVELDSEQGRCAILIATVRNLSDTPIRVESWEFSRPFRFFPFNSEASAESGFEMFWLSATDWGLLLPHWFLTFVFAIVAAVPWIPWSCRYRVRTLLLVMTIIGGLLGIIYDSEK